LDVFMRNFSSNMP